MTVFETAELGREIDKDELKKLVPELRVDLVNAQYDLRDADFPVIVLIMGDDRAAVNALMNGMGDWMDARYIRFEAFGPATDDERERPRFWRYWRALPRDGLIGALIGAWSFNTCVGRIWGDFDNDEFVRRAEHDAAFERSLVDDGALLLKFWFHLPKKEHKKRLKRAKKSPAKHWYVDEREQRLYDDWDEAIDVADDYVRRTNTVEAPWHVIESTDVAYAGITFARTLLAAMRDRLARRPPEHSTAPAASPLVEGSVGILETVDLTKSLDKDDYEKRLEKYTARIHKLVDRAHAKGMTNVLAFEGWDAAGKGGVIRRITRAMDARDYRVVPIAAPTEEEKAHHYLWRFWTHMPRAGSTLIFDRSWYGRVLVERVEGFATEAEWTRAYAEINDFEAQLVEHGYLLLKFWLQIDPDEQLRRFEAREQTAFKKYKITDEDYRNREKWPEYARAVNDMVEHTSTDLAPWHLIPANDKRWARIHVMKTFCDALEKRLD